MCSSSDSTDSTVNTINSNSMNTSITITSSNNITGVNYCGVLLNKTDLAMKKSNRYL